MINADFRTYIFSQYVETEQDAYGQPEQWDDVGEVKMAIYITSQSIQDNINYKGAQYLGLTYDSYIDDSYIVHYNDDTKLKVLYVNPHGRMKQVFLAEI